MMKHHYPPLFAGTPDETAARRFSERVYELSEYLATVMAVKLEDRGDPVTITWHSSCHALREMDVIRHSKALIRQLKNVTWWNWNVKQNAAASAEPLPSSNRPYRPPWSRTKWPTLRKPVPRRLWPVTAAA
jgi:hypothetical protein